MPKRDRTHMESQKARIMRAAFDCIMIKGFERTSIADIRKAADLSAGTIYVHFENKEDLLAATLAHFSKSYGTENPPASWAEFKNWALSGTGEAGLENADLLKGTLYLLTEATRPGYAHDAMGPIMAKSIEAATRNLERLAAAGEVELPGSAEQSQRALSAIALGTTWLALLTDRPMDEAVEDARMLLDWVVKPRPAD